MRLGIATATSIIRSKPANETLAAWGAHRPEHGLRLCAALALDAATPGTVPVIRDALAAMAADADAITNITTIGRHVDVPWGAGTLRHALWHRAWTGQHGVADFTAACAIAISGGLHDPILLETLTALLAHHDAGRRPSTSPYPVAGYAYLTVTGEPSIAGSGDPSPFLRCSDGMTTEKKRSPYAWVDDHRIVRERLRFCLDLDSPHGTSIVGPQDAELVAHARGRLRRM